MGVYSMNDVMNAFMWFCVGFTFAQILDICVMAIKAWRMKKKMES